MVGKDLIMATLLGSGGGSSGSGGGGSGGGEEVIQIAGWNVRSGTLTLSEDANSGTYSIQVASENELPARTVAVVYMLDNFPDGGTTKHFIGAFSTNYLNYSSYPTDGVALYSSGMGSMPNTKIQATMVINTNGDTRIRIPAGTTPLLAGVTYGWLYFYK